MIRKSSRNLRDNSQHKAQNRNDKDVAKHIDIIFNDDIRAIMNIAERDVNYSTRPPLTLSGMSRPGKPPNVAELASLRIPENTSFPPISSHIRESVLSEHNPTLEKKYVEPRPTNLSRSRASVSSGRPLHREFISPSKRSNKELKPSVTYAKGNDKGYDRNNESSRKRYVTRGKELYVAQLSASVAPGPVPPRLPGLSDRFIVVSPAVFKKGKFLPSHSLSQDLVPETEISPQAGSKRAVIVPMAIVTPLLENEASTVTPLFKKDLSSPITKSRHIIDHANHTEFLTIKAMYPDSVLSEFSFKDFRFLFEHEVEYLFDKQSNPPLSRVHKATLRRCHGGYNHIPLGSRSRNDDENTPGREKARLS